MSTIKKNKEGKTRRRRRRGREEGKPRTYYKVSSPYHETVSMATFSFIPPLSRG